MADSSVFVYASGCWCWALSHAPTCYCLMHAPLLPCVPQEAGALAKAVRDLQPEDGTLTGPSPPPPAPSPCLSVPPCVSVAHACTLSAECLSPWSHDEGSVWPHDNSPGSSHDEGLG